MATKVEESIMVQVGGLQNKAWAADTSKFGYQMLMKMGWKAGKGVGKDLQGTATHVTIQKRSESLGLGCSLKQSEVTGWSSTSGNFADVLSNLKKKPTTTINRRILFSKRVRNKNASGYGATDMAAILGEASTAVSATSPSSGASSENDNQNDSSDSDDEEKKRKKKKAKKEKKAKKAKTDAED
ncbi:hypothetical protein SPRG_02134 [Saprolegnia parasitica CBS 223.65]|uniref:PinX1-related protein 1 n=1 Tax=Saprolegnia parasitica (strain CBS 223.65) TaxID=695850 RepID=A0A067D3L9_SAPPC|nr:hypothetical protein SPRG_02134 [Saprolegnia parasitica CBS 223.65]KDO33326.1 hypothetical protein SPRG_02134 [Saprolegnia parasitica CBS 223.65]|eukprot:XP_012196075.1 hypothetical protein SPRG_02134 [Saprolegnia parasitica CBS 223.65]